MKKIEQISAQQCIDFNRHKRNNIVQKFISIIKYFQEKTESDREFLNNLINKRLRPWLQL